VAAFPEVEMRHFGLIPVAGVFIAASLSGCASAGYRPPDSASRPEIISSAEIARSSSTNVWDLLRKRARMYNFAEDRFGRPRFITTKRGASTIVLAGSDNPLVLIDGARLGDVAALRDMPTDAVESIELQSGINGTSSQGTNAVAGVIYIHTKEASST
jgi:outer membrane cobalamin receptor